MKPCHPLKYLWHSLHCKVLFSHRSHHLNTACLAMASASSILKQKKELLVIASDQYKYCHLHGRCRCHTEAFNCIPHDHECSNIEASTCVSEALDGHGCSSHFENVDALCDHSECFSKCHNDASHDVFTMTVSLSDDVCRDIAHESHEKYVNNCVTDGLRSLSITDGCDATSHDKARRSGFDEIVRKSSTNGDVHVVHDVNGCNEMSLNTGSGDGVEKLARHCNGDLPKGHFNISSEDGAEKVHICNGDSQHAPDAEIQKWAKRPFCKRCEKAQDLCICNRFKGIVQNKIKITILQNPKEKHHAVGSARVALLGLENVNLIDVPEMYSKESFRIRPKMPGSKRNLAGRGGKKILLKGGKLPVIAHDTPPSESEILQTQNLLIEIFDSLHKSRPPEEIIGSLKGNVLCGGHSNEDNNAVDRGSLYLQELESLIPPGVALLYPSDKAIELSEPLRNLGSHNEQEVKAPCHLIVLDGTWSKARRIYFENPWLQSLPHYKLLLSSPSLYEGVRKQPKPGCLSTLESIVYALKVLEPDTGGLDGLLEVFDSMVEDQRRCKQMKCLVQECETE